ncbi:MAG: cysteine--tRNA ligase [Vicingaceae bacterium]
MGELHLYNTLSRKKEVFKALKPPFVGMYVCGPTVYGDAHLGHAKSYISFDVIYRYLLNLGYKVRYVQNITDVGHLTDDADQGEDKIAKQSRLERVDPMEVVERYMANYYRDMDALNNLRPSIAPRPSGHIQEQIASIEKIIENGYAYEQNGSVYFDVVAYNKDGQYGKLSGRNVDEMLEGAANRTLDKQEEKKNPVDFALWKRAGEEHLMQWDSPWGSGYPGWHIECSVMSQKYLGDTFDIHGGGLENAFPHHECEIAQAEAEKGKEFARYWLHNNMVTINGQKMGKSLGNSITLEQLFSGDNNQLDKAYSPMTVRFFILMSHYRSTLDFSNEALTAAEKGLNRLMNSLEQLAKLKAADSSDLDPAMLEKNARTAMDDDFNTPMAIAQLFEGCKWINLISEGKKQMTKNDLSQLQTFMQTFAFDILGLKMEESASGDAIDGLMDLIIDIRQQAKVNKNYELSDKIRNRLNDIRIEIRDGKEGTDWVIHP